MVVKEYLAPDNASPYRDWFDGLDATAAAKVAVAVTRMAQGNLSNTKGVGKGIHEYRINFGPGYRVYFGSDGEDLIILLGGGTKKSQRRDIAYAQRLWADYKERKKEEARHATDKGL